VGDRSTPIDSLQEWHPQPSFQLNNNHRSHSADPTNSGLFSTYPSNNQQQSSANSFSLDSHLNTSHYYPLARPSYRPISSISTNFIDHQQDIQGTISKDSIDKQQNDQTSSTNESLTKYVKMLLERSPTQDTNSSKKHPLAKTNRSLHDIQRSIEQLNLPERDPKTIVDDLVSPNESHNQTSKQHKPSTTNHGGVKKTT